MSKVKNKLKEKENSWILPSNNKIHQIFINIQCFEKKCRKICIKEEMKIFKNNERKILIKLWKKRTSLKLIGRNSILENLVVENLKVILMMLLLLQCKKEDRKGKIRSKSYIQTEISITLKKDKEKTREIRMLYLSKIIHSIKLNNWYHWKKLNTDFTSTERRTHQYN
jgi:hypothetical protein